jgi:hypothetical protein
LKVPQDVLVALTPPSHHCDATSAARKTWSAHHAQQLSIPAVYHSLVKHEVPCRAPLDGASPSNVRIPPQRVRVCRYAVWYGIHSVLEPAG